MKAELPGNGRGAIPESSVSDKPAPEILWPVGPRTPNLTPNQLHIWCAAISGFAGEPMRFHALLSSAERSRAERFRFPKDRDSYIIRHGIWRVILSRYLNQPPSGIKFQQGPLGKPEVQSEAAGLPVHFNDSHSNDLALFGVTLACPIGVDIELLRPVPEFEKIAAHYFSPNEVKALTALPIEIRPQGFFASWTRREALLKATGEGIGRNLAKVEVTLAPEDAPEILHIPGDPQARANWKLHSFSPAPGYLGAAAFRHGELEMSQWRVPAELG